MRQRNAIWEVFFEFVVRLVVILFHNNLFNGSIHAIYLSVSPRMIRKCQPMFNSFFLEQTASNALHSTPLLILEQIPTKLSQFCEQVT